MKFFKVLLIFIIVIVILAAVIIGGALIVTGLPGKSIDVEWTEADFESYLAKGGIDFDDSHASAEDMISGNIKAIGKVAVDTTVTNEELTAVANMAMNGNSIMKDVKIVCNADGTMDTSCVVGDLTPVIEAFPELEKYQGVLKLIKNKPVYMNSSLVYNQSTGLFEGVTNELYVGIIKIPVSTVVDGITDACSSLQSAVKSMEGFSVEEFSITEEGMNFDGTIPEKIESLGPLTGF